MKIVRCRAFVLDLRDWKTTYLCFNVGLYERREVLLLGVRLDPVLQTHVALSQVNVITFSGGLHRSVRRFVAAAVPDHWQRTGANEW